MKRCILYTILFCGLLPASGLYSQVYFLNGDATALGNDCYQLTPAANWQNGTVWYADQIDLNLPFDIQFRMNLGDLDGSGADGICFVLQTVGTSAIGVDGGGMGYLDFGTSLGIEFDTWQNGEFNDPGYDHIAIQRDGDIHHDGPGNLAGPVQMDPFNQNAEDGQDHVVQVNWNPNTQQIQVYFDCNFRLQAQIDLANEIFGGENLVYWGFTAATGGAINSQVVCLQENILSVGDQVRICPGASTTLSAGSSLDGVYTWSPSDFLDDPTSPTPIANPPQTTTYNVTFTDLCGNNVDADIEVVVEPLELEGPPPPLLNCLNGTVTMGAASNFSETTFTWSTVNGNLVSTDGNVAVADQPGQYTLEASALEICEASITFTVNGDLNVPAPSITAPGELDCATPSLALQADGGTTDAIVSWSTADGNIVSGAGTLIPVVDEPGTYVLSVTDASSGCQETVSTEVTGNFVPPALGTLSADTLSCVALTVVIDGPEVEVQGDAQYEWTTPDGQIVGETDLASVEVSAPGIYQVEVTDSENGCSATAEVEVISSNEVQVDFSSLSFPNILSANGDEVNDSWKPFLADDPLLDISSFFAEYELNVYNRWGALVFEGSPSKTAWEPSGLAAGTYYYHLQYESFCGTGTQGTVEGYIQVVD